MNNISRLAIVDASNNVYDLSTIITGAENASEFVFSQEASFVEIEEKQQVLDRITATLNGAFVGSDVDEAAILALSNSLTTSCQIVGIGVEQYLAFVSGTDKISFVNKFNGQITGYNLQARKDFVDGYNSVGLRRGQTYQSKNLLSLYNVKDGDANDLFGFNASGDADLVRSQTGGVQTLQDNGDMVGLGYYNTFYQLCPFVGERLTLSLNVTAITTASATLSIAYYDSSNVIIGTATEITLSGTGIQSVSMVAPSGAHFVRGYITYTPDALSSLSFKEPMISLSTNTEFVP
jgi:hypothetical protein